jgi:hypothetical protein
MYIFIQDSTFILLSRTDWKLPTNISNNA